MDPVVVRGPPAREDEGATRFCMGAAWREVTEGKDFEQVLEMVRGVAGWRWKCAARSEC